jgi:serine phosphatase RsbU (regulator of sigma subunit)
VDMPASTITYATAGHPPPMLRLPDSTVKMLDNANGTLIGASIEPPRTARTAPFPPGARLVMYTDGLVERRDRPLDEGMHEAAAHLAAIPAHLEPAQVIESLLEALIGGKTTDDDVAVLVVEHRGEASD